LENEPTAMPTGTSDYGPKDEQVAGPKILHEPLQMSSDDSDSWEDSDSDGAKPKGWQESIRLRNIAPTLDDAEVLDSDDEPKKETFHLRNRHGSDATDQTFMLYTPDEEQSVIKKFDRRLVLFVALLYMLSFLDRSSMHEPDSWGLIC